MSALEYTSSADPLPQFLTAFDPNQELETIKEQANESIRTTAAHLSAAAGYASPTMDFFAYLGKNQAEKPETGHFQETVQKIWEKAKTWIRDSLAQDPTGYTTTGGRTPHEHLKNSFVSRETAYPFL